MPKIFILVNPRSGGNIAGEFLQLSKYGLVVEFPTGDRVQCFSYSLHHPGQLGIKHLRREVENGGQTVRCIIAGGDGTMAWAVEEIVQAGIPLERLVFGIVPFGTGNDFAHATGWDGKAPKSGFLKQQGQSRALQDYVREWLGAGTQPFDIWEISLQTRASEHARFEFIEDGQKTCSEKHRERYNIRSLPGGALEMTRHFCNYFSVGFDARVGIGFDKKRLDNKTLNRAMYALEGTKKLLFKKKDVIASIIDTMQVFVGNHLQSARDGHIIANDDDAMQTVFLTGMQSDFSEPELLGNPVSLVFMNVPSIAGGLDLWNASNKKVGINGQCGHLLKAAQDFGDSRIECLSYTSGLDYCMEHLRAPLLSGQGKRVFSDTGPVRIGFREPDAEEYYKGTSHCKGRVYMQVDGEYFIVYEPQSVVIRHAGKINVLVKPDMSATPSEVCSEISVQSSDSFRSYWHGAGRLRRWPSLSPWFPTRKTSEVDFLRAT